MQCDDARFAISIAADDALDEHDRNELHAHLTTCEECARFEGRVGAMSAALAAAGTAPDVSAAVVAHTRTIPHFVSSLDAPVHPEGDDVNTPEPASRPRHRRWYVAVTVAAVVALLLGTVALVRSSGHRRPDIVVPPHVATQPGPSSTVPLSDADRAAITNAAQTTLDAIFTGDPNTIGNALTMKGADRLAAFLKSLEPPHGVVGLPDLRASIGAVEAHASNLASVRVHLVVANTGDPFAETALRIARRDESSPWAVQVDDVCAAATAAAPSIHCPLTVVDPAASENVASAEGRAIQLTLDRYLGGDVSAAVSGADLTPWSQPFFAAYGTGLRVTATGISFSAPDSALVDVSGIFTGRVEMIRAGDGWRIGTSSACRLVALYGGRPCPAPRADEDGRTWGAVTRFFGTDTNGPATDAAGQEALRREVVDALATALGADGSSVEDGYERVAWTTGNESPTRLAQVRRGAVGHGVSVGHSWVDLVLSSGVQRITADVTVSPAVGEDTDLWLVAWRGPDGVVRIDGYQLCWVTGQAANCPLR